MLWIPPFPTVLLWFLSLRVPQLLSPVPLSVVLARPGRAQQGSSSAACRDTRKAVLGSERCQGEGGKWRARAVGTSCDPRLALHINRYQTGVSLASNWNTFCPSQAQTGTE